MRFALTTTVDNFGFHCTSAVYMIHRVVALQLSYSHKPVHAISDGAHMEVAVALLMSTQ